jgi:hypothetical protein
MNDFLNEMKKACTYSLVFKCKKYIECTDNEEVKSINAQTIFYISIYGTEFESNYYYTDSYSTYKEKIEVVNLFIIDLKKAVYDFQHGIAFKYNDFLVFNNIIDEMQDYRKLLLNRKLEIKLPEKNIKTKLNKI